MSLHRSILKGIMAAAMVVGGTATAMADGWLPSREGPKVWLMGLDADDSTTWTGGRDGEGYGDGPGVMKRFSKGELLATLEGTMKKGKFEGQVRMVANDGVIYQGNYADGVRSGQGTMTWKDGRSYVGGWGGNTMHGKGIMKRPDGVIYDGEYDHGSAQGQGIMKFPNGNFYEGQWSKGNPNGKGTSKTLGKIGFVMYEGDFVSGRHTGKGVQRFPDGTRYEGEFLDDAFNGMGTLYGPDGKIMMRGKWERDKFASGAVPDVE